MFAFEYCLERWGLGWGVEKMQPCSHGFPLEIWRDLHQRIDDHRYSAIRFKHLKNNHGLENIGDLTNNGKLDCLIYEMLFIKKKKAMLEHTIRLHTRKTIYLNLSLFTCIVYVLSPCTVYIKLNVILFSLH